MTSSPVEIAPVADADLPGVQAVAAVVDELVDGAGEPDYVDHLRHHGRFLVARLNGGVVGYAGTRAVGRAQMLTDLFVHPDHHGGGIGRRLLERAWLPPAEGGPPERMTFASSHPAALPLYVRAGLTPYWPLLWLRGDPSALTPSPCSVVEVDLFDAAALEQDWTGADRGPDYAYWASRPSGRAVRVDDPSGRPVGVGVLGGTGHKYGVAHFCARDPSTSQAALLAALQSLDGESFVAVPGPHPAAPQLIAAGWRLLGADTWLATRPDLVDDARMALSPGLA